MLCWEGGLHHHDLLSYGLLAVCISDKGVHLPAGPHPPSLSISVSLQLSALCVRLGAELPMNRIARRVEATGVTL